MKCAYAFVCQCRFAKILERHERFTRSHPCFGRSRVIGIRKGEILKGVPCFVVALEFELTSSHVIPGFYPLLCVGIEIHELLELVERKVKELVLEEIERKLKVGILLGVLCGGRENGKC